MTQAKRAPAMSASENLYERDFHAWALANAELIRERRWAEVDLDHVAEELESMGRSERRELANRLAILLAHLLKWVYQPNRRGRSWRATIEGQRADLRDLLADSPSLQGELDQRLPSAYRRARIEAEKQTGIRKERFPEPCPFTVEQALDDEFWPD